MPDFSQPGIDGTLPSGFKPWQWGVTYTARPEASFPLLPGREYRITAAARRKVRKEEKFTAYGRLYQQADAIASSRIAALSCPDNNHPPHTWIARHGWRRIDIGAANDLLIAFISVSVISPSDVASLPQGERTPTPTELIAPGGATPEMLASQDVAARRMDEVYIDFDHRDPPCASPDVATFSYGEYLAASGGTDFAAIVERAEDRARLHYDLLQSRSVSSKTGFKIIRREWFALRDPDFAVVQVYFQA